MTAEHGSPRTSGQSGVTLIETMVAVGMATLVIIPMLGFAIMAFGQQSAARERNLSGAGQGMARTYFLRDIASADTAFVSGASFTACAGGSGSGGTLLLVLEKDSDLVTYSRAPGSDGGTSLWRRTCGAAGGAATDVVEVTDDLTAAGAVLTCKQAGTAAGTCRQMNLRLTATSAEETSITAAVRDDGGASVVNPGGPVYESPTVVLSAAPTSVFRGDAVAFSGAGSADADGSGVTYYWEFGDGTTSTSQSPSKSYSMLGSFTAILTVTNSAGTPSTDYVVVEVRNRPPIAVIASPSDGFAAPVGQSIAFSSAGSNDTADGAYGGVIASMLWEFGDGTTSTLANPTHIYSAVSQSSAGYTVKLTVTDNNGGTGQAQLKVKITSPPTGIIASPTTGATVYRGQPVSVSANGSLDPDGVITSYLWDWGDGTPAGSGLTASHTYAMSLAPGNRTVTLTVTDNDGFTNMATITLNVVNRAPVPVISAPATGVNVNRGVPVSFASVGTADPDGTIASYDWDWGDGTTHGTTASGTHTFANSVTNGSKTVRLTVTDNNGATASTTIAVNIVNLAPSPVISSPASGVSVDRNVSVSFASGSTDADGTITTYDWDWGDGTAHGTTANASHTYALNVTPGAKTVKLTVTDNNGATSSASITVNVANQAPTVSVTAPTNGVTVNRNTSVSFTSTASDADGTISSYSWDWGDGTAVGTTANASHTYANNVAPGAKTVTLTVRDNNNQPTSVSITVNVANQVPTATITAPANNASVTRGVAVNFTATASDPDGTISSYLWDWGDGTANGSGASASHTFANSVAPGAKVVMLTVTDNTGATATRAVTVNITNVLPTVSITAPANGSTVYKNATVNFAASATDSDGTITNYSWDFGDGTNGATATPSKIYTSFGAKTVVVTATDNNGGTRTATINVVVASRPPSISSISASPSSGRVVLNSTLSASVSDPDGDSFTYDWDFGDGTAHSSAASPAHGFTHNVGSADTFTGATYTVKLTVTDVNGATASLTTPVTVDGAPAPTTFNGSGSGCQGFLCLGTRYIDFSWSAVAGADRYQIYIDPDSFVCGEVTQEGPGTSMRISGLCVTGSTYSARIRARDASTGKWGAWFTPDKRVTT